MPHTLYPPPFQINSITYCRNANDPLPFYENAVIFNLVKLPSNWNVVLRYFTSKRSIGSSHISQEIPVNLNIGTKATFSKCSTAMVLHTSIFLDVPLTNYRVQDIYGK